MFKGGVQKKKKKSYWFNYSKHDNVWNTLANNFRQFKIWNDSFPVNLLTCHAGVENSEVYFNSKP